jgi:hypothetical protein
VRSPQGRPRRRLEYQSLRGSFLEVGQSRRDLGGMPAAAISIIISVTKKSEKPSFGSIFCETGIRSLYIAQ